MRYSLRWKLLGSFMLLIIVLLGSMLVGVSLLVKEHTRQARQQELQNKGAELAATVGAFYAQQGNFTGLDSVLTDADSYLGARVWLVNGEGQLVNASDTESGQGFGRGRMGMGRQQANDSNRQTGMGMGMHGKNHNTMHNSQHDVQSDAGQIQSCMTDIQPIVTKVLQQGQNGYELYNNRVYGQQMLLVAVPVTLANGQRVGAVVLQEPYSSLESYMQAIYYYLAGAGVIAVLVALVLVAWLTRRIVHPLTAMEKVAEAMAGGDYSQQLAVESQDEVGRLSAALNSLAQDLHNYLSGIEKQEKLRRDFVANVSHELRTPLTIIRGYDEALLTGAAEKPEERHEYCLLMQEEIQRLERLIADLLDLSRLQGNTSQKSALEMERLPLTELAEGLVHKLEQQAEQKQLTLKLIKQEPAPYIQGNGDRIMQLLLIFVDNALKYTPAGGSVTVTTTAEGAEAVIKITDTGKGIPEEDLPYVWERFYKVDKAHSRDNSGTGLGMAIAKEIINLHKGKVTLTSIEGQGTTVTLRFPGSLQNK